MAKTSMSSRSGVYDRGHVYVVIGVLRRIPAQLVLMSPDERVGVDRLFTLDRVYSNMSDATKRVERLNELEPERGDRWIWLFYSTVLGDEVTVNMDDSGDSWWNPR